MKKSRDAKENKNEESNTSLIKILTVALTLKKKMVAGKSHALVSAMTMLKTIRLLGKEILSIFALNKS